MKTATQGDVMAETGRSTVVLGLSLVIFALAIVLRIGLLDIAPDLARISQPAGC